MQQADARMAALAAGTDNRPVTTREIQSHLDDFALAKEFSVYGKIGGLSGGQKVSFAWFWFGVVCQSLLSPIFLFFVALLYDLGRGE